MKFAIIPDDPFSNIAPPESAFVSHPLRGVTENLRLAARFAGVTEMQLRNLKVGQEFPTQHGVIRRID